MDYLDTLSDFASGLDYAKLDHEVKDQVGWILADTLAAIVAGSAEPELRAIATRQSAAPHHAAQLIGLAQNSTPEAAAFINGSAGTFLEMDEGNRFSRGHPAIHVIPAALALSQERHADAAQFMAAVVVGYEVGSRFGAASQLRSAMHPHGTWGTLGAAAACARIAEMDSKGMRQTINIAASLTTATSKQTMLQGGLVRNVYAGLSNRHGLLALNLAECGFTGEHDGPSSLLGDIISESFQADAAVDGLGQDWHVMHNYFKLHSCCRYNHGTLDAIDHMSAAEKLPSIDDIDRIEVDTYHLAAELNDPSPQNTLAAKFSVPFAVATRLVTQSSALSSFTWEAVRNTDILALAQKVSVSHDPAMSARLPMERPAKVTIHLKDGRQRVGQAGVNRGDDASPYTRAELRDKFLDLTGRIWPKAHCEKLLQASLDLAYLKTPFEVWTSLLSHPAH
jgi:2-methylcitrate dehydratase PrpD